MSFFLTIIPSIKPGWPPWYCWRALSVGCRTRCWEEGGVSPRCWRRAPQQSGRNAALLFTEPRAGGSNGKNDRSILKRFDLNLNPGAFFFFLLFVSYLWRTHQLLSKFYYRSHQDWCVTAGWFISGAQPPPGKPARCKSSSLTYENDNLKFYNLQFLQDTFKYWLKFSCCTWICANHPSFAFAWSLF